MTFLRKHRWLQALLLLGPAVAWGVAFIAIPFFMAVRMSLWQIVLFRLVRHLTLTNYRQFFSTAIYHDPLFLSLENGAMAACACLILSVPVAHFIRFRGGRHRAALFGAVVIALWMGYLLRIFGWRIILGDDGPLNKLLISAGVIHHPISFLIFSRFAVVLTQTHLALAFAFIPVYAAMERLPETLLQAGADLGATRLRQFLWVELPLISGGVITGGTFAFVLAFGDYFAPTLVGDPASLTAGNIASDQFGAAFDWPLGAAIGVIMTITVLLVLAVPWAIGRGRRATSAALRGGIALTAPAAAREA